MAKLHYLAITSLDGYIADADGNFDWAAPDDEVHAAVNDFERAIGTHLYGRRLYETMLYWATAPTDAQQPAVERDYAAIWQAADKIVYSTTLTSVSSARTRLERTFDVDAIRRLKDSASSDLSVGGANLARTAIAAGLVDAYHLFVNPVIVGAGSRALPDGARLDLELLDERRFTNGVVHLHYQPRNASN